MNLKYFYPYHLDANYNDEHDNSYIYYGFDDDENGLILKFTLV